jgi:hypothetical protein
MFYNLIPERNTSFECKYYYKVRSNKAAYNITMSSQNFPHYINKYNNYPFIIKLNNPNSKSTNKSFFLV